MARNGIAGMLAATAGILAISGCSGASSAALTDGEQIVLAALKVQVADGRAVCVDRRTTGDPLVNWRTMSSAPQPSRALIGWSLPRPVRSLNELGMRQVFDDQIRGRRIVLREPEAPPRLPLAEQRSYGAAARGLSPLVRVTSDRQSITIRDHWGGRSTVARWWPLNRIASTCSPLYTFSDPVWDGGIGFLTVKSDHWGTTYALRKDARGWAVTAQWTPWLY